MRVGLVRKWTVVAIIAAALGVIACKDDDADEVDSGGGVPGGGQDSGSVGGGMDSGTDAGGATGGTDAGSDSGGGMTYGEAGAPCPNWDGGPVSCGTQTCYWHKTTLTCSNPGCITLDGGTSLCAIDTNTLGGVDAGLPPLLPYDAPGVISAACGMVGDSFEPVPDGGIVDGGTKGNGFIDTNRTVMNIPIALRYPGCCTQAGWCSGHTGMGMASAAGSPYAASNAGYGCLTHQIFYGSNPNAVPTRCDPTTGELVEVDGGSSGGDGGSDAGAGDSGASDGGGNG